MPEIKSLAGDLMQAQGMALFHSDAVTTEMLHKSAGLTPSISGATLASAHSGVLRHVQSANRCIGLEEASWQAIRAGSAPISIAVCGEQS